MITCHRYNKIGNCCICAGVSDGFFLELLCMEVIWCKNLLSSGSLKHGSFLSASKRLELSGMYRLGLTCLLDNVNIGGGRLSCHDLIVCDPGYRLLHVQISSAGSLA